MGPPPAVAATRLALRQLLTEHAGPGAGRTLLVACSGGADSLALAAAAVFVAPRLGWRTGLVTIDHGLQPGSAEQAHRVVAAGRALGLDPAEAVRVTVDGAGGPEGAARAARYAALAECAAAAGAHVLLGHTRDDQAETVLLGLGRGSGPRSIAGMVPVDGPWLRPFLDIDRATTRAACTDLGLKAWDDPHNTDPRFVRVRLRSEVLPLLDDVLQGGVGPALARTGRLLRDDLDALDGWAASVASDLTDATGVDARRLAALPRAVRTRVLRDWAGRVGAAPLSAERTAALDDLVTRPRGQGSVPLPGGVEVSYSSGRLSAFPAPHAPQE